MLASLLAALLTQTHTLTLPAYTAYTQPAPYGAELSESGQFEGWTSRKTRIEWGGHLNANGPVRVVAHLSLPPGQTATYNLTWGSERRQTTVTANGPDTAVDFGQINVLHAGWQKIFLSGIRRTGPSFGQLKSLSLEGDCLSNAQFNLKERRNSASVHLTYPVDKADQVEWFYNEVTAVEDPEFTYFEACGFHRGYFGMQINSPTERRVIFSVWDSGSEAVDRGNVGQTDRVRLIEKGKDVLTGGFGNEGTGGHSHLVYPWKTGIPQRFLLHAVADRGKTQYTGYFFDRATNRWRLIASFEAPKDGAYPHGLYSFIEDFGGENGNLKRKALYGPAWIRTTKGEWKCLNQAKFTYDRTGGKDRLDYDFGTDRGHFFLQNGGFEGASPISGSLATLPISPKKPPTLNLDSINHVRD